MLYKNVPYKDVEILSYLREVALLSCWPSHSHREVSISDEDIGDRLDIMDEDG